MECRKYKYRNESTLYRKSFLSQENSFIVLCKISNGFMFLEDIKLKKHNLIYFINQELLICTIEMLTEKEVGPFNWRKNNVC